MPLLDGDSTAVISANIRTLIHEGRSREQAAAIAYRHAGRPPRGMELVDILRYVICPSCGDDAAVWSTKPAGWEVLDCSTCSHGEWRKV